MNLEMWQVIVLSVYSGISMLDALSFNIGLNGIIQSGIFTGLVCGNVEAGLFIGGTLQSFALGIGTYGGASIPNYSLAAIIVTAIGGGNISEIEPLITLIGIPVATIAVQFDILGRFTNTVFQQRADRYVETGDMKKIELMNWLGCLPWSLSRFIPTFLALSIPADQIVGLTKLIPAEVVNGFAVAGRMLPAVGFTILLKYLPTQRNLSYLILGFVLAAYLGLNALGVSLIGVAIAMVIFKNKTEVATAGGDDYDE